MSVASTLDVLLVSVREAIKSWLLEIYRLGAQLVYLVSLLTLWLFSPKQYQYQMQRRKRIRREPPRSAASASASTPKRNIFRALSSSQPPHSLPRMFSADWLRSWRTPPQTPAAADTTTPAVNSPLTANHPVRARSRYGALRVRQEAVHLESTTTGLLEDAMLSVLYVVESVVNALRRALARVAGGRAREPPHDDDATTAAAVDEEDARAAWSFPHLRVPLADIGVALDTRDVSSLVRDAGYPYANYLVRTSDGYLLRLERLPRRTAPRAVYMQHGIFDSSFAWVASGATSSLAFQAYDAGFDVWLGNFRGAANSSTHLRGAAMSSCEYWSFNVDDHAHADLAAMIAHIHRVRRRELVAEAADDDADKGAAAFCERLDLSVVAHSMGAAAVLMHLVRRGLEQRAHGVARCILLSPAGIHRTAPLLCRALGPALNAFFAVAPVHAITLRSRLLRYVLGKAMADVRASSSARSVFVGFLSWVLGGNAADDDADDERAGAASPPPPRRRRAAASHPFATIHNLAYNSFGAATSVQVFRHFWAMWRAQRFQAYDYGARRNLELYGTEEPLDYAANYGAIRNVDIYLGMGLKDRLIEPVSVISQYQRLRDAGVNVRLKALPDCGHIELVLCLDDRSVNWIVETLTKD